MGRKRTKVLHNVHLPVRGEFEGTDSYNFVMYTSGYHDVMSRWISSSNDYVFPFSEAAELEVRKRINKEELLDE